MPELTPEEVEEVVELFRDVLEDFKKTRAERFVSGDPAEAEKEKWEKKHKKIMAKLDREIDELDREIRVLELSELIERQQQYNREGERELRQSRNVRVIRDTNKGLLNEIEEEAFRLLMDDPNVLF